MSDVSIRVRNLRRQWPVDSRLLGTIADAAIRSLGVSRLDSSAIRKPEVAVFLVGAQRMAGLNEGFLRHVGPTDVITFDYREGTHGPSLHGDIFVCLDEAQRQAGLFRTTWQAEVVRYLVHGLLHLCGHDDLEAGARRRMKRVEHRIVRRLASEFDFKRLGTGASVRS